MLPSFPEEDDYIKMPVDEFDKLDNYIPVEVCHYTSMQTGLEKILKTKKLRIGKITSTNDPLESEKRSFATLRIDKSGGSDYLNLRRDSFTKLREEWRVLCMCCHHNPTIEFKTNPDFFLSDHHEFGISYSRMWAQYAGNHSGICLLFDGKRLDQNIRNANRRKTIHSGLVRYNYEKSVANIPLEDATKTETHYMRRSLDTHYREHFLYKSEEWMYEHEFRWLVRGSDLSKELYVPIDNAALKAVVVGVKFSDVYLPSVNELCKELGVTLYKIVWNDGRPQVNEPKNMSLYKDSRLLYSCKI